METLIINIPNKKIELVKQILTGLGVTIQQPEKTTKLTYRQKLEKIPVLTEDELKSFEEGAKALENFKPEEW